MYQTPAQQPGVQTSPSQQPISYPQYQGPPGQPVTYQMSPGQPQPVFTGQTAMGQQGQPTQYHVPAGQPVQPVQGHGVPAPPPLNQDEDVTAIRIDTAYLKSGLNVSRFGEFCALLIAWSCVVAYSNRILGMDDRANFFRGITIFSWVMVIIFQIMFMLGINKNKRYFGRPSNCTLVSLGIQVVLTILLIACSTSFAIRSVDSMQTSQKVNRDSFDSYNSYTRFHGTIALIYSSSIFGLLTCLSFLEDIYLLSKMYRQQRAKEIAAAGVVQQPGTYPQQPGPYPQQPGTYPQQPGPYPQQPGAYPQQQVGAVAQPAPQPGLTQM